MTEITFEAALEERAGAMADACTRCGKCVEACPSVEPAGIAEAKPVEVISGVIGILRGDVGTDASRRWAAACTQSGACIKACDYGVNPRFLLAMARIAIAQKTRELPDLRRQGVEAFRKLNRDVSVLSRLQLDDEALARLGQGRQGSASQHGDGPEPDVVFYTGCNVLKTPHIALLALDIMDSLGVRARVLGGPSHCCGIIHMGAGDVQITGRMATGTLDKLSRSTSGQVISWCPSCYVQFTETTLPAIEKQRGQRPFEMTPFMLFLAARLQQLRPLLLQRVEMRVALHKHPGVAGVVDAAEALLRAVPGIELIDLKQPAVGLQSVKLSVLPAYKRELQRRELQAARDAGVDALVAVYHSDHRELCAHERDWPLRIVNVLEIVGASMGLHREDDYKRLKLMQDADAIVADCHDLIERHGLDPAEARRIVAATLLGDQPLPLCGPDLEKERDAPTARS
jgi:Fe-S oxidoreductase